MARTSRRGSEKPLLDKRRELTSRGYPELAKITQEYTDVEQAIKTAEALRKVQDRTKKYW